MQQMLRHFIEKVHQSRLAKPRMVICVPSGITGVEHELFRKLLNLLEHVSRHGIEEPMAAAIGSGMRVKNLAET